jgi:16S rRNA (guanine527-N7)-methyltransferase
MDTARIAVILEPFLEPSLSQTQLEQISIYIDLLLRWNARINLTAIREEEEIVTRHFGESLFMARHLFPPTLCHPERSRTKSEALGSAKSKDPYSPSTPQTPQGVPTAPTTSMRVLDIGSGAGFPGLPLKIWTPNIDLTLVESNHKKATFLREVARTLTLTNINIITGRAEALAASPDFPRADIVTLRAVERFDTILPHAAMLMARSARLALLISTAQLPHLSTMPELKWQRPILIPHSHSRVLSIGVTPVAVGRIVRS